MESTFAEDAGVGGCNGCLNIDGFERADDGMISVADGRWARGRWWWRAHQYLCDSAGRSSPARAADPITQEVMHLQADMDCRFNCTKTMPSLDASSCRQIQNSLQEPVACKSFPHPFFSYLCVSVSLCFNRSQRQSDPPKKPSATALNSLPLLHLPKHHLTRLLLRRFCAWSASQRRLEVLVPEEGKS